MYHDTSFMIYITKLYRVALALGNQYIVGSLSDISYADLSLCDQHEYTIAMTS